MAEAALFVSVALIAMISRAKFQAALSRRMPPLSQRLSPMFLYLEVKYLVSRRSSGTRQLDLLAVVSFLSFIAVFVIAAWIRGRHAS